MFFALTSPILAFVVSMYAVAIFGEFIKEDGMITQEFICVWIVLILVKIGGYLYTRRPRNHHPR
jgi:EamA domain-containing membrane protein RarD